MAVAGEEEVQPLSTELAVKVLLQMLSQGSSGVSSGSTVR